MLIAIDIPGCTLTSECESNLRGKLSSASVTCWPFPFAKTPREQYHSTVELLSACFWGARRGSVVSHALMWLCCHWTETSPPFINYYFLAISKSTGNRRKTMPSNLKHPATPAVLLVYYNMFPAFYTRSWLSSYQSPWRYQKPELNSTSNSCNLHLGVSNPWQLQP